MSYQNANYPAPPRSPWFYVLWGCGGCACLGAVVVIGGIVLMGLGLKRGVESISALAREAKVDLKVQNDSLVTKQGKRYIVGKLKNISPTHTYAIAFVEFSLFDKGDKPLTSVIANTKNLKPGSTWEFKAPVVDPAAVSYKFREVSGFQDMAEDPNIDPETRRKMKAQRAIIDKRMEEIIKKAEDDAASQNKH